MKKARKALLTLCAALLLVSMTVGATVAYLTASTGVVTNTFTIGNVAITLDETDVDVYGVADGTSRVKENTYKLLPGHNYIKDPIVHVANGSEQCWVFVKVTNEIAAIEDTTKIVDQMTANNWKALTGVNDVYYYDGIVDARTEAKDLPVFAYFKILSNVTDLTAYNNKTVTIDAYAVQADGFTTADAAWQAASTDWN